MLNFQARMAEQLVFGCNIGQTYTIGSHADVFPLHIVGHHQPPAICRLNSDLKGLVAQNNIVLDRIFDQHLERQRGELGIFIAISYAYLQVNTAPVAGFQQVKIRLNKR